MAPGTDSAVTFVVWHNAYPNERADHAFEQRIKGGGTYLIVNGWGRPDGTVAVLPEEPGRTQGGGPCRYERGHARCEPGVMGSQWISQTTNSASITDRLAIAYTVQQHRGYRGLYRGPLCRPAEQYELTGADDR